MIAKNRVENLLKNSQVLRDSDPKLLLAYWREEGLVLTPEQEQTFLGCTTAETITRCRRALKHKYPASPAVDERRFKNYVQYKRATDWWNKEL